MSGKPRPKTHQQTAQHRQHEDDVRRWRDLGERCRERWGKPVHVSDRDALAILVAEGALPADHGIAPRDVYAFLTPTREGARAGQIINRLGPWRHPSWGPVMTERGWLYVLDFRPAVEAHRLAHERGYVTCHCAVRVVS